MSLFVIFQTAFALSMDAFSISVANGVCMKKVKLREMLKFGLFFGAAQAIMPVIGYYLGNFFYKFISGYSKYIAFIILLAIGGKMLWESFKEFGRAEEKPPYDQSASLKYMLILAVATSIDALAVGISFAMMGSGIFIPALLIGVITFIVCFIGVYIGHKVGNIFKKGAEILGGCMLILIGFNFLFEWIKF